ncbi:MAG TPA: hypothetical protein P5544_11980 [Candidatus Nanopelagicales bacterium]|nr:hypothetical protein [Candidatus Nanopelagicales bacterium]
MSPVIVLVAGTDVQRAAAEDALAFLRRGGNDSGRVVQQPVDAGPGELTVGFGADTGATLTLVDGQGWDWERGDEVCRCLLAGEDAVTVRLVDRQGAGSRGRVGVARTVTPSVKAGMSVLGPLIVQYVHGARITGAPPRGSRAVLPPVAAADRKGNARFAGRVLRSAVTVRNWQVARLPGSIDDVVAQRLPGSGLEWQGPARGAFWADPCVVVDGGQEWLFVEELGRRSGLGLIRAASSQGGRLVAHEVVLSTAHHLSYPQVYRVGGRWLATVETCAARNPFYTFDRLGDVWRPADDLPPLPPHLADAVVRFDPSGRPEEVSGTDATVNADAVFVRYTWDGQGWGRDDSSVYVDVRLARGAGTDDDIRGWRAVQDCAGTYGRAASLLDPDLTPVVRITGADVPASTDRRRRKGVHTLTWTGDGQVVWCDGWLRRITPLGGLWRLRERQHGRACQG